jgi:hypothetical protein
MAGRPRLKRVLEDLTLLAQAELDDSDAQPTALDYTAHWIANGGTLIRLAAKLQEASTSAAQGPYEPLLQGETIGRMLRKTFGDQVVDARFTLARARGAHALVESTHEIADETVTSSEDASRARNRIGTRQWAAQAYERNTFGQRGNQVNVAINLGQLHLDALRHRAIEQAAPGLADGQVRALPASTEDAVGIEYDDVRDDVPTT